MADEPERCPTCGQPTDGNKQSTHQKLRDQAAEALERARQADTERQALEDELAGSRKSLAESKVELAHLRRVEAGVLGQTNGS